MDDTILQQRSNSEQVRVRFLSNLGRDYYVQISEYEDIKKNQFDVSDSDCQAHTDHPEHLQTRLQRNMAKEREIFLKATLQLLDLQDCNLSIRSRHHTNNSHGSNAFNSSTTKHQKEVISSSSHAINHASSHHGTHSHSTSNSNHHDDNNRYDVIRLGFLKKARSGAFSAGSTSNFTWKRKYVELRHGVLTYDDYTGVGPLTVEDLTISDQSNISTRRTIPLSVDHTTCRVYENPNANFQDDRIFEIAIDNGPRRIWMASSASECQEWIRAIHSAMLGISFSKSMNSANVLASILGNHSDNSYSYQSHQSDNNSGANSATNHSKQDDSKENSGNKLKHINSHQDLVNCSDDRNIHSWLSIDGAAAPYAHNMSQFLTFQQEFNASYITESSYRKLLQTMFEEKVEITIPVLFIKSKTTHANFILSPQDSLNTQNVHAKCTSQVWKDLQRDIIVVNGDLISGELGAEAMIGALVRHISDKVEELKKLNEIEITKHRINEKLVDESTSTSTAPRVKLFSPLGNKTPPTNTDETDHKTPYSIPFAVTEAQIVQCARDLLVLCNRTQSGGDTYFCVDALLCGDKSRGMSILTPFSPEAEPLHFKVDVVQMNQFQNLSTLSNSPSRKRGAVTDQKIVNSWRTKSTISDGQIGGKSIIGMAENDMQHRYVTVEDHVNMRAAIDTQPISSNLSDSNFSSDISRPHSVEYTESPRIEKSPLPVKQSTVTKRNKTSPVTPPSSFISGRLHNGDVADDNVASDSIKEDKNMNGNGPKHVHNDSHHGITSINTHQSPLTHRRPQLDLISELEKDGFYVGVTGGHRGKSPSSPSDNTMDHHIVTGTSQNHVGNEEQTIPLFPLTYHNGSSTNLPPKSLPTNPLRISSSIPDQLILKDDGKDDSSIISELTWDTYNRSANSKIPNGVLSIPSTSAPYLGVGDRYNQHSGLDDQLEPVIDEEVGEDDESTDPSLKSFKSKKKSLLKKLGKSLKPFKIPEGFEGLTSPFKQRRGSHKSEMHEIQHSTMEFPASSTRERDRNVNGSKPTISCNDEKNFKCIRIQVEANCKYKVCSANPTGIEELDSWAVVTGTFYQSFYIVGDGSSLLGIADRLVTISVDGSI